MKISALPTATTPLSGAELFPIVQSGNTRRVTLAQLAASISSVGTLSSLTVSGNLTVDTNTLFVDAVNNRVGVGTATPTSTLEVAGGAARISGSESSVSLFLQTAIRHTGSGGWFLDANTGGVANSITIRNGSGFATMAEFSASGNLGLGVTPSAWGNVWRTLDQQAVGALAASAAGSGDYGLAFNAYNDNTNWLYKYSGPSARYRLSESGHAWFTAPSGTAGNAISFTQAMTLDANGGLQTLNTIGVGNRTPATSGAGISFPATQSASSDANTLDDYEEGTWVPTLTNLTLGNAVTAFRYVKVGQMVTLDIVIEWGSTTSSSGQWRISLPFNAQATGGGSAYLYDDTGSEYVVPATVYTASFGQTLVIGSGSGAGFVTNTAPFTWAQNDRFGCSITYRATA